MKKIAVIGATGYVGSAVVKELAERGHQVVAFARNVDKVAKADNVQAVAFDVENANFAELWRVQFPSVEQRLFRSVGARQ